MRYNFKDGWVDINEAEGAEGGNTYFGETAHKIMFETQRIQRINKGSDYQGILKGLCIGVLNGQLKILNGR